MKKLKLLPLLLIVVLTAGVIFAGCAKDNKVKIELLTWHTSETSKFYAGYEQVAKDYEKLHSDVDIVIRSEPESSYKNILETGFQGGTASEIIQMKTTERTLYSSYLLDLASYFNTENPYDTRNAKWIDNFEDGFQKESVGKDGTIGYSYIPNDTNPYIASGRFWIYNKDLVKKAGLDIDKTPTTWKEMFAWCEKLTEYANSNSKDSMSAAIAGDNDVASKVTPISNEMGPVAAEAFFDDGTSLGNAIVNDTNASSLFNFTRTVLTCLPNEQKEKLVESYPDLFGTGMNEAIAEAGKERPSSVGKGVGVIGYMPYYPAMFKLGAQFTEYFQDGWIETDNAKSVLSFAMGQTAMITGFSWGYATIEEQVSSSKNFPEGVGAFPTPCFGADTLQYCVQQGWITQEEATAAAPFVTTTISNSVAGRHEYGFSVNEKLKENPEKLEIAIDFLKFMTSKDEQQKYVNISGSASPVKGVAQPESSEIFKLPEDAVFNTKKYIGPVIYEWSNNWGPDMYAYIKNTGDYASDKSWNDWNILIKNKATDLHRNRFVPLRSDCEAYIAEVEKSKPDGDWTDIEYIKYKMFMNYYYADDGFAKLKANYNSYLVKLA